MRELNKIRCLVVDDEPLALQLIVDYISQFPSLKLVHATTEAVDALQWLYAHEIDVVFLDINMPELSGMNFLKLAGERCKTVLVTAYQEYAVESYQHEVLDYLLKPVTFERFQLVLKRIEKTFYIHAETPPETPIVSPDFFFLKADSKFQRVDHKDIIYLKGLRDYVAVFTDGGKLLSSEPLRYYEKTLPSTAFLRIHKSFIVAVARINYIEKNRVFINKQFLPIGDLYKEAVYKLVKPR